MFFTHPAITQWARSLGTMSINFRMDYIGVKQEYAMTSVRESWNGSVVTKIDDEEFTVWHQDRLEPFIFHFLSPNKNGNKVSIIRIDAAQPFPNVFLAISERSTNYFLRCPENRISKVEKQLCKALKKNENIPIGIIK